jgi:hypothetical protein
MSEGLFARVRRYISRHQRLDDFEYVEPVFGWFGWCVECGKQDDLNENNQCRDCWENENGNEWL